MTYVGDSLFCSLLVFVRYQGAYYLCEQAVILYEEEADEDDGEQGDSETCQE